MEKELNKIITDLEYSAFNLCDGKKYTDLPSAIMESTGAKDTLLIAIRDLKELASRPVQAGVIVKLAENRIDKLWEKKIPYVNDDCDDIVENIENEIDLLKQLVNGLNYYTKNLSKFSE